MRAAERVSAVVLLQVPRQVSVPVGGRLRVAGALGRGSLRRPQRSRARPEPQPESGGAAGGLSRASALLHSGGDLTAPRGSRAERRALGRQVPR